MIVKFSSLNRYETPSVTICNPGSKNINGCLTNAVGTVPNISDFEIIYNFNTSSELNFRCNLIHDDDESLDNYIYDMYKSLQNRRLLFVNEIGYFVINDVSDGYDNGVRYKDINAKSVDAEISHKTVPYIENGTYPLFSNEINNDDGLLEKIIRSLPNWYLGTTDNSIINKFKNIYRTFEDIGTDTNCLEFMLTNIQDAYECIFEFDIINRLIYVYDQNDYVRETGVHITKDDVIKSLNITETSEDVYTSLSVFGANDLTISAVNPTGDNIIHNFSNYLDWMDVDLRQNVSKWQSSISEAFYDLELLNDADLEIFDWMSDELRDKIIEWNTYTYDPTYEPSVHDVVPFWYQAKRFIYENDLDDGETSGYTKLVKEYYDILDIKYRYEADIDRFNSLYKVWTRLKENIVAGVSDGVINEYANVISSTMSNIIWDEGYQEVCTPPIFDDTSENLIQLAIENITKCELLSSAARSTIESINRALNCYIRQTNTSENEEYEGVISEINNTLSIKQWFGEEYETLMNFVYEGVYTDEYIALQKNMTNSEKFKQMSTLFQRALRQSEKISKPTTQIDIDTENIVFSNYFQNSIEQIETGCVINVELSTNDIASLFLSTISINYEDQSLKLTFGNRLNRADPKSLFEKTLGNINKTANSIGFMKDIIYPIKNGEFNAMREEIQTSRNITLDKVISSSHEDIVYDSSGYTGRTIKTDASGNPQMDSNGNIQYEDEQIKITGKNIVFTDDSWKSCKTALGKLALRVVDNSGNVSESYLYGINAEAIIGNLIIGNRLKIVNSEGDDIFSVVGDQVEDEIVACIRDKSGNFSKLSQTALGGIQTTVGDLEEYAGFKLGSQGMIVHKSDSEITNLINHKGMYVKAGVNYDESGEEIQTDDSETESDKIYNTGEIILSADNKGVDAINLHSRQYLIVGNYSRFENYNNSLDSNTKARRTGCFYVNLSNT